MITENNSAKAKKHRIEEIEKVATEVFGSPEKAKKWLIQKNIALGGTPISILDTEAGGKEVLKVLSSIAYGGVA